MEGKIYSVCVIGGGSAGTMAALRCVLNNDDCLFFPGSPKDKKRSRALWVRKVENMPAHLSYKRGIEDPNAETFKWINESAFKEKLHLQKNTGVMSVSRNAQGYFEIVDSKGNTHTSKFVILCTGVMDVQPKIQGTIEKVFDYANAQTIDYCIICDGHHVLNKETTIIGHTNSAAWVSIMLHERYSTPITILTNGEDPIFEDDTNKLVQLYGFKVHTSPIIEIVGKEKGKLLEGYKLENQEVVKTDISFVALGMMVYNEIAKQVGADLDERGFVKAQDSGETSVAGFYVAGDLKAQTKKQIYTAWDTAVNAATAINQKLRMERRQNRLSKN